MEFDCGRYAVSRYSVEVTVVLELKGAGYTDYNV